MRRMAEKAAVFSVPAKVFGSRVVLLTTKRSMRLKGRNAMGKRETTVQIKQIAEASGFSQSTVSIVLNGRGDEMRISKNTQRRILEVSKSLDYRPNIYARRLRGAAESQTTQIIGIFWNDQYDDSIGPFINGAYASIASENHSYEIMVKLFPVGRLSQLRDSFSSQKFNGIIVGGGSVEDIAFLESQEFDVPIVLSGRASKKYSHIFMNGYLVGMECAKLFAKAGIKSAAYLGTTHLGSHSALRELGFSTGCRENGIQLLPEWILRVERHDAVEGYHSMKKFLQLPQLPEAIFINYASVATGALFAFQEAHVRIPEEMKVIVYGMNDILQHTSPSLTMEAQPMKDMGCASMELLMLMISNNIDMPITRMVEPNYFWGDSFPKLPD